MYKVEEVYKVIRKGGSIGEKPFEKTFDTKEEAQEYCRRMNKLLSPGEKKFYGIKYTYSKVKEDVAKLFNTIFEESKN